MDSKSGNLEVFGLDPFLCGLIRFLRPVLWYRWDFCEHFAAASHSGFYYRIVFLDQHLLFTIRNYIVPLLDHSQSDNTSRCRNGTCINGRKTLLLFHSCCLYPWKMNNTRNTSKAFLEMFFQYVKHVCRVKGFIMQKYTIT